MGSERRHKCGSRQSMGSERLVGAGPRQVAGSLPLPLSSAILLFATSPAERLGMEQHLSPAALARLMTGQAAAAEAEIADAHVAHCRPCRDLAATVAAELRRNGVLVSPPDGRSAVLLQLESEERTARRRLLAHIRWAELKKLAMEEQTGRLEREPELQTLEMFQTILADAAASEDDPLLGEERAFVAYALAGFLSGDCCPEAAKRDLQAQAMLVVVDCRR